MTDKNAAFDWSATGPSKFGQKMQMESNRAHQVGVVPRKPSQSVTIVPYTPTERFNMRRVKDFGLK